MVIRMERDASERQAHCPRMESGLAVSPVRGAKVRELSGRKTHPAAVVRAGSNPARLPLNLSLLSLLHPTIRRLRKEPGKPVKGPLTAASVGRAAESRRRARCGSPARPVSAGGGNGQARQDQTRLPEWDQSHSTEVSAPRHLSTLPVSRSEAREARTSSLFTPRPNLHIRIRVAHPSRLSL